MWSGGEMTRVSAYRQGPMFGSQNDESCGHGSWRKCVSVWMSVFVVNDEIVEKSLWYLPFVKVVKKSLSLTESEHGWKVLCMRMKIVCLSYFVALPKSIQPMCNIDTNPFLQLNFGNFVASDELSVYRRNIKRQHPCVVMSAEKQNKDCGQRFVLLALVLCFWLLTWSPVTITVINPIGSDSPLWAPKTSKVSKISSCKVSQMYFWYKPLTRYLKSMSFVHTSLYLSLACSTENLTVVTVAIDYGVVSRCLFRNCGHLIEIISFSMSLYWICPSGLHWASKALWK